MYSARGSVPAVALLFVAAICCLPAFSQSAPFLSMEARSVAVPTLLPYANRCNANSYHPLAALRDTASRIDDSPAPCDQPTLGIAANTPCASSGGAPTGCVVPRDFVHDDLSLMGKQGKSIMKARDKALEILQSENSCTAWFRSEDPDPAATFRTLSFVVDRHGDVYVRIFPESGGLELIRNPYVASVIQGDGPHAIVTINGNGAFFLPVTTVVQDTLDGGPAIFQGARAIQVGPYAGGTFRAQVLTLLHEFGHAIDLLPTDHGDNEGKSRHNTGEVLQACRAQVESKDKPHTLSASR